MEIWTLWLILAGVCFIMEIATEGFLMFWLGVGGLASMTVSFFSDNYLLQLAVFVIVSTVLILCTRKFTKKVQPKTVATNVYTIIGKKAVVSVEIDNIKGHGQIKVDGDVWTARNEADEIIPEGTAVEILRIDGVKAVVKKI